EYSNPEKSWKFNLWAHILAPSNSLSPFLIVWRTQRPNHQSRDRPFVVAPLNDLSMTMLIVL
ncbi:MAG: hypothetical protein AB4372_08580, partial [Xenococcus sp. (in: cyanobacteria)]